MEAKWKFDGKIELKEKGIKRNDYSVLYTDFLLMCAGYC